MEQVPFRSVIGIDVHQKSLVCCAILQEGDEVRCEKQTFGTFKNQKIAMAEWCASLNPDLVIMESTGIYWKSPYAFLEKVGIRAAVVNARHIKQLEGKKTDMGDAEWLAHVGRLGVFIRSFVPAPMYRELRLISRYLRRLKDQLSAEKNRFHKILADAGFNLSAVFSDLHGVNAQKCVEGIIAGLPIDEIMQSVKTSRLRKAKAEEVREALNGELTESHQYLLLTIQKHMDFLEAQIAEGQIKLTESIREQHASALSFLQTIPGVGEESAVNILIELGGEDMSPFKTADRLASWIGVCPGNNESAGKRRHGHIRKGNYYLRRALCECAQAAVRTKGVTFQGKYASLRSRKGSKRALVAIMHKIVDMIFFVLNQKTAYRDPKIDYEAEIAKKNARRWAKMLASLNDWKIIAIDLKTGEKFRSSGLTPSIQP